MSGVKSDFLTEQELKQISEYEQPARQRKWLLSQGIKFVISRTGKPLVMRGWLNKTAGSSRIKKAGINLDALHAL